MSDILDLNWDDIHLLTVSIGKVSDELSQITLEVHPSCHTIYLGDGAGAYQFRQGGEVYIKELGWDSMESEMANQVHKCSTFYFQSKLLIGVPFKFVKTNFKGGNFLDESSCKEIATELMAGEYVRLIVFTDSLQKKFRPTEHRWDSQHFLAGEKIMQGQDGTS